MAAKAINLKVDGKLNDIWILLTPSKHKDQG